MTIQPAASNMRFLVEKVAALRIGWNERPLASDDLYKLCRRFRITLQEMPLAVGGFYYRAMGKDCIAVDSRLPEKEKLAVMFHELGHFLFHAPETGATASFHHVAGLTREECEADVFALCAILPKPLIQKFSPQELVDDGFPPKSVADRFAIFDRLSI
jgi:Zn-dependent peptidase ImmA (M78 family)